MSALSRVTRSAGHHAKDLHLGLIPRGEKAGEGYVKDAYTSRNIERLGVWFWNNYLVKWDWGLLPKGYNPNVHGPYVPYRYYGPKDTKFHEVRHTLFSSDLDSPQ